MDQKIELKLPGFGSDLEAAKRSVDRIQGLCMFIGDTARIMRDPVYGYVMVLSMNPHNVLKTVESLQEEGFIVTITRG